MSVPSRHDPYAALRFPEFRRLILGGLLLTAAIQIQAVVIAYELYRLTRDPLMLGLVGLAEALPFIGLALFGGVLADRRDKVALMQVATAVMLVGSAVLLWTTRPGALGDEPRGLTLAVIYGVLSVLGLARGIYSPASASLRAFLVPRAAYPNSASWSSTFWQAGAILGPLSAGFLYAGLGLTATLAVVMVLMLGNLLLVGRIARRPPEPGAAATSILRSLSEGLRYVRGMPMLFHAMALDMLSVLFGGVVAILPLFAEDILQVGSEGLGILRAAPAVGAMLTVLVCAWAPPTGQPWRNLLLAVTGFALATLVFGLSTHFWLSVTALFLVGASDSISVVVRSTILQVMTSDAMRGRVQSVNSVFISTSNEIGAFESGLAARLIGAVPSVLFGASVTLGVVFGVWRRTRALLTIRLDSKAE